MITTIATIVNLDFLKVVGKNDVKKSPQMVALRFFNGDLITMVESVKNHL